MVLILSNDDVAAVLTMDTCMTALEEGYREEAAGRAVNQLRYDTVMPLPQRPERQADYEFKTMAGIVPKLGVAALRMSSTLNHRPIVYGEERSERLYLAPGGSTVGLVQLYSTETGEPLAFFPDGMLQGMRVGGTYGLATKYLARRDSKVIGLLGSGWQARFQVAATQVARPGLELVKVYSPNPAHREQFAHEVGEQYGVTIVPVDSAQEAAQDVDVLISATNAKGGPVITPDLVRKGMHVGAVTTTELSPEVRQMADMIVVHSAKEWEGWHGGPGKGQYGELSRRHREDLQQSTHPLLENVIAGNVPGRTRDEQITTFWSGSGMGVQFASVGAKVYELATQRGLGHQIPTEWFTQTLHT